MYKIVKSENLRKKIEKFVNSLLKTSLSLFIDTGIENVSLIRENYLNSASIFKKQILLSIDNVFSEKIIPKKVGIDGELSVIVSVGNFRLFVDYSEDKKEKIRYIENIEFYRK